MKTATLTTEELKRTDEKIRSIGSELDEVLASCEVRLTDEIPELEKCLQFTVEGESFHIGTLGNFSVITGKAKSRKSFMAAMVAAQAVNEANSRAVLYFDTEQGKLRTQRQLDRIRGLCGADRQPRGLHMYSLRSYDPATRLKIIEQAIGSHENIGFIFIDGISDLVFSTIDDKECIGVVTKIMQWSEYHHCHICTVLHENPVGEKVRGHIGTEVMNKGETIIKVEKVDNQVSTVESKFSREADFSPFQFKINEEGLPEIIGAVEVSRANADAKKKKTPHDFDLTVRREVIREAFDGQHLGYSESWRAIKVTANKLSIDAMGDNIAKDWLSLGQSDGMILKDEKRKYYYKSV